MSPVRGIYTIACLANGRTYVGHSTHVKQRLKEHRLDLRGGKHDNIHLQNAWRKYGETAFEFETFTEMPGATLEQLLDAETHLWDLLGSNRFNMIKPGVPPTYYPEVRAKISDTLKGHGVSPTARAKMSASQTGKTHTAETRAKMSTSHKGHGVSLETRDKIRAANKGKKHSPETRAKMSAAHKRRSSV